MIQICLISFVESRELNLRNRNCKSARMMKFKIDWWRNPENILKTKKTKFLSFVKILSENSFVWKKRNLSLSKTLKFIVSFRDFLLITQFYKSDKSKHNSFQLHISAFNHIINQTSSIITILKIKDGAVYGEKIRKSIEVFLWYLDVIIV